MDAVHDQMTMGALAGVRVVDVSGLAPGPFASMILADHGAEVVSVLRPSGDPVAHNFARGKTVVTADLRDPQGREFLRRLCGRADVFVEGSRPGVMENLGLGPETLCGADPRLIYVRLTGYGQSGPLRRRAGHDINYLALSGPLGAIGLTEPVPTLNLLGDFASGSLMAVLGITFALLHRARTGRGQVVDAAIVDGAALLSTSQLASVAQGEWSGLGRSMLSGAAPFYGVYRCRDGRWFSVGAYEPKFYANLLRVLDIDADLDRQHVTTTWPQLRGQMAEVFATRTRDEWTDAFADVDACAEPVLDMAELAGHPHLAARGTVVARDGRVEAAPAPRLSDSPGRPGEPPEAVTDSTRRLMLSVGYSTAEADRLIQHWHQSAHPR